MAAVSRSVPDGVPYGGSVASVPARRSITPSSGSGVAPVMPASSSAAEFTHHECPSSDMMATGLSLTTASRELASGPLPGTTVLLQPCPRMTSMSGLAAANSATAATYSFTLVMP